MREPEDTLVAPPTKRDEQGLTRHQRTVQAVERFLERSGARGFEPLGAILGRLELPFPEPVDEDAAPVGVGDHEIEDS